MEDTIRFGKVSNIDYAAGKMEVAYEDREDSVTDCRAEISSAFKGKRPGLENW